MATYDELARDLPRYSLLGMIVGVTGIALFTALIVTIGRSAGLFVGLYASIVLFAIAGFLAVRSVR